MTYIKSYNTLDRNQKHKIGLLKDKINRIFLKEKIKLVR